MNDRILDHQGLLTHKWFTRMIQSNRRATVALTSEEENVGSDRKVSEQTVDCSLSCTGVHR